MKTPSNTNIITITLTKPPSLEPKTLHQLSSSSRELHLCYHPQFVNPLLKMFLKRKEMVNNERGRVHVREEMGSEAFKGAQLWLDRRQRRSHLQRRWKLQIRKILGIWTINTTFSVIQIHLNWNRVVSSDTLQEQIRWKHWIETHLAKFTTFKILALLTICSWWRWRRKGVRGRMRIWEKGYN